MSNNINDIQEQMFGASYPYYKNINTPSQIGMSSNGNLQSLGQDINGLIQLISSNVLCLSWSDPLTETFHLIIEYKK